MSFLIGVAVVIGITIGFGLFVSLFESKYDAREKWVRALILIGIIVLC